MIVVDSSAIIAIAQQEADGRDLADRIERDDDARVSVASVLECSMVLRSIRPRSAERLEQMLDQMIEDAGLSIEPVTLDQLALARLAHLRFGKGTGHPAQLNFGDCFSYALAKSLNAPLLYKGSDFAQTDIQSAL